MARNSFIQISKLANLKGRIDYITNPKRQENLYAIYNTIDDTFWHELAKYNRLEFKKSGSAGSCIESRELIIALPEQFCEMDKKKILEDFTEIFKSTYGVECIAAMHHNKTKTNLHIHLIFAEREMVRDGIEKVATRNMFYNETGKHVRTKKEILDDEGNIRPGYSIIKKGDVYENNKFTKKKPEFKARSFLAGVKVLYTDHINSYLKDKDKLRVFDNKDVYLATKKIGKNNPKAEQIKKNNEARRKWNSLVDEALFYEVPREHIRTIRNERIIKMVKKYGNTNTKTVGGVKRNKSTRESPMVAFLAEMFVKVVEMACECLTGLIKMFKATVAPKPPYPIDKYEEYYHNHHALVDAVKNANGARAKIRDIEGQIDRKEYKFFGGKKELLARTEKYKAEEKKNNELAGKLKRILNVSSSDESISIFNRVQMEMYAYKSKMEDVINARENLKYNVSEYMKEVKEPIKIEIVDKERTIPLRRR